MKHGLDKPDGPTFKSDFGTGYDEAYEVSNYIAARAAVFFQSIIKQTAQTRQDATSPTTHKKFIDCLNYHHECDLGNADNNCTPSLPCSNN